MTSTTLNQTIALSALTGMRSMSGPAVLALRRGGALKAIMSLLAAGEMAADKTAAVGDRTDPIPLGGRAMMGAIVGGAIANEDGSSVVAGAVLGATVAVLAAHLAYHARKRLPLSTTVGGFVEDAVVLGIGAYVATRAR